MSSFDKPEITTIVIINIAAMDRVPTMGVAQHQGLPHIS